MVRFFAAIVVSLLSALSAFAAEIHVPADQATIQSAIDVASAGDVVLVAPGAYVENIDFLGKSITVRSSGGQGVTTIDGSALTSGAAVGSTVTMTNGEGAASVLEGFTIIGGSGAQVGFAIMGGGLLGIDVSPTIRECHFTGNDVFDYGGGLALFEIPGPTLIEDCSFTENTASHGGGMFVTGPGAVTVLRCLIDGNTVVTTGGGAALASLEILVEDCVFSGNSTEFSVGGGLSLGNIFSLGTVDDGVSTVRRCEFVGNSGGIAAGFHCYRTTALIEECRLVGNMGALAAFAMDFATVTVRRCVIGLNDALGGRILGTSINPSTVLIDRCTVAHNTCESVIQIQPNASGSLSNSIVFGNSGNLFATFSQQPIPASYSDVSGGLPGTGNIDADPLFVDPLAGDFRLLPGSPCIDAGDPGLLDPDGTAIEMGALPFDDTIGQFRRGDANQDGNVDIGDGIWVLNELFLGGAPSLCLDASDANDDGMVDLGDAMTIFDFVLLAGAPLPAPGMECGEDPTEDALDCGAQSCL